MIFRPVNYIMKDGETFTFKTPEAIDCTKSADFIHEVSKQTPYLLRCGDDERPTDEEEAEWIQDHRNSDRSILISAYTSRGDIVASADMKFGVYNKNKHTASVGIVIDKHYWGIGIGSTIFDIFFSKAREYGIETITLQMVDDNQRARALYSKFGFKQHGLIEKGFKVANGDYKDLAIMQAFVK